MKEYLAKLLKALAEKNTAMQTALTKSAEAGTTPDEATEQEIQQLEKDIAAIKVNIKRTEDQIAEIAKAAQTATPVQGQTPEQALQSTTPSGQQPHIQVKSNLPKGVGFAKFVKVKMIASIQAKEGNYITPIQIAKNLGENDEVISLIEKAVGTTTDPTFASPLVHTDRLVGEYIDLLRSNTVLDKLQFRKVPFDIEIPAQSAGAMTSWVGEGEAAPITNPQFSDVKLGRHKTSAIVVYALELLKRSDPSVDILIRDDLIQSSTQFADKEFLGTQAGTEKKPAGLLNGVSPITSSGNTAENLATDLRALRAQFITANLSLGGAVYLMSEVKASEIADMRDALGNTYFKGMEAGLNQKTLNGIPVIESENVGNVIVLVKTSEILMADDGQVDIAYSDQATLIDGTVTHNLWQENKFAIRAGRFMSWTKRRPIAASFIQYA